MQTRILRCILHAHTHTCTHSHSHARKISAGLYGGGQLTEKQMSAACAEFESVFYFRFRFYLHEREHEYEYEYETHAYPRGCLQRTH